MLKIFMTILICMALVTPAYAYRIETVRQDPPTSITADRVFIDTVNTKVLSPGGNIYAVTLINCHLNSGQVYIYSSASELDDYFLVSGNAVRIEVDNLSDIFVSGNTVGDSIHFIAEVR